MPDVFVSYDQATFTAHLPEFDLSLSAGSLAVLRVLVAEAVAERQQLCTRAAAELEWTYAPLVRPRAEGVPRVPRPRDDLDTPEGRRSPQRHTQAMVDRKLEELRRSRRPQPK